MEFKVVIDDFYLDEEELGSSLKQLVKNDVANQIRDSIKTKVIELTDKTFKEQTQKSLEVKVETLITEISSSYKIKRKVDIYNRKLKPDNTYSTDTEEELTIEEYISETINKFSVEKKIEANINATITRLADNLSNEMKQRYDMLFASQLVNKMNTLGMLKESVADILLKGEGKV